MFRERNGWGIHTKRKILGTLGNTPAKPAAVSETAQNRAHAIMRHRKNPAQAYPRTGGVRGSRGSGTVRQASRGFALFSGERNVELGLASFDRS